MFQLKLERLNKQELIGKGSFGEVYPYQKDPDDRKWVVKVMNFNNLKETKSKFLKSKFQEIILGFGHDHPFLVPVKGFDLEENGNGYTVYLKVPRKEKSLYDAMEEYKRKKMHFEKKDIIRIFYRL